MIAHIKIDKIVESCKDCPFYKLGQYGEYCSLVGKNIKDSETIPSWCPFLIKELDKEAKKRDKLEVLSADIYVINTETDKTWSLEEFARLTNPVELFDREPVPIQQFVEFCGYDMDEFKGMDNSEIIDYIRKDLDLYCDNTANYEWFGPIMNYCFNKPFVCVRLHYGGDVRSNYGDWYCFKFNRSREFDTYILGFEIRIDVETNKGNILLASEDIEGVYFIVVCDETGTFEEGNSVHYEEIENILGIEIW